MRRLVIRLIVLGVLFGGGWLSYQLADTTKCSGPRAEEWARTSLARLEEAARDLSSLSADASPTEIRALALRAHARYSAQQGQAAPPCLEDLQRRTGEALYYEWKSYEAAAAGDYQLALDTIDKAQSAREGMEQEIDHLAGTYGWDISQVASTQPVHFSIPTRPPVLRLLSPTPSCTPWQRVSMSDVGRRLCVHGIVKRWYSTADFATVIRFTEDPADLIFIDRTFTYVSMVPGSCVMATGVIEDMGSKLALNIGGSLFNCH